ncbi:lecithin retinol acyltransferase family protein [Tenacibaculum halocynthiae]|uniref:lecithin retinol acyltransferase family protein n=1 Tax=Tenacibaculum halocynthiae TaxID=1254437 RepID=UPI003D64E2C1
MIKKLQLKPQLYPADVIVAKKRNGLGRILNHYVVYVGNETFIGNLQDGVKVLSESELSDLLVDYEPVRIKPFEGTDFQRNQAINRAYHKLGQKYSLLNFNCEHFANWVQKGKENSVQVTILFSVLVLGLTYKLIKVNNGKRR